MRALTGEPDASSPLIPPRHRHGNLPLTAALQWVRIHLPERRTVSPLADHHPPRDIDDGDADPTTLASAAESPPLVPPPWKPPYYLRVATGVESPPHDVVDGGTDRKRNVEELGSSSSINDTVGGGIADQIDVDNGGVDNKRDEEDDLQGGDVEEERV
jgi:hypothetical protein